MAGRSNCLFPSLPVSCHSPHVMVMFGEEVWVNDGKLNNLGSVRWYFLSFLWDCFIMSRCNLTCRSDLRNLYSSVICDSSLLTSIGKRETHFWVIVETNWRCHIPLVESYDIFTMATKKSVSFTHPTWIGCLSCLQVSLILECLLIYLYMCSWFSIIVIAGLPPDIVFSRTLMTRRADVNTRHCAGVQPFFVALINPS